VVGAVNIALILALSAVALAHARSANFNYVHVPVLDGRPVDTGLLALVFGVVLLAFFGHTSAANSAKVVLGRDPSGRALVRGNIAALSTAAVLYALTALSFGGALDAHVLEGAKGTALEPLAAQTGVAVRVLGAIFAVLAIGMGSVYASLGLYNQMIEWRPRNERWLRFATGAAVPTALFAVVLWLIAANRQSFTTPLGYAGALTVPLIGGVMPMVLVIASRRRAEYVPKHAIPLVGSPLVAGAVAGLFLVGVLVNGLFIWHSPLPRVAALAVAVVMAGAIIGAWRLGAFRRRTVIELRAEPERDLGAIEITAAGHTLQPPIQLDGQPGAPGAFERFSRLREAVVDLPADAPTEVHVWAHRVTRDGDSEDLPVDVDVTARRVVIRND
jgi:hypothetical protein